MDVLIDGNTRTIKPEIKKQEAGSLGTLLALLAASIVQLVISSLVKHISGRGVRKTGIGYMDKIILFQSILEAILRLLIVSITNLDLMPIFSRNNLPRIKDGAYIINLNDKKSERTHCVSLFIDRYTAVYFDSSECQ